MDEGNTAAGLAPWCDGRPDLPAPQPDADPDDTLDTADDLLWLIQEMPASVSSLRDLQADCDSRGIACTPEALASLLAAAHAAGDVEIWEHGGRALATLTPAAAARMGVQLGERGDRWLSTQAEVPAQEVGPAIEESDDIRTVISGFGPGCDDRETARVGVDFSMYTDRTLPEPLDAMIAAEDASEWGVWVGPGERRLRNGMRVAVTLVLGMNQTWPKALTPAVLDGERVCRGCLRDFTARARLPRNAYCAACDRSGVDGLFPPIEKELLERTRRKYVAPDPKSRPTGGKDHDRDAAPGRRARGAKGSAA